MYPKMHHNGQAKKWAKLQLKRCLILKRFWATSSMTWSSNIIRGCYVVATLAPTGWAVPCVNIFHLSSLRRGILH